MKLEKILLISKYLEQLIRFPHSNADEIDALTKIKTILFDEKHTSTPIKNIVEEIYEAINPTILEKLYNKAEEFNYNINQDLPIIMNNDFKEINKKVKKRLTKMLAEDLANDKEQETNFNKSIGVLLNPNEENEDIFEYHVSMQIPFSQDTLFIKITTDGDIFYRIEDNIDWGRWSNSDIIIQETDIKYFKDSFTWQLQEEKKLIDEFISISYRAAHFYFKNMN